MKKSIILEKFIPIWNVLAKRNPKLATHIIYRAVFKKRLNLKDPITLNEKMHWLKLYRYQKNSLVTQCADKLSVRDYVESCGCQEILNELYGVWESVDDIDWNALPNKFVLKCTHGSGYNIVCKDKSCLDIKRTKGILNSWLDENYGTTFVELIYTDIKPRIICEKYIETKDDNAPTDYKFFCSYGDVKFIYVMIGDDEEQDYYTNQWEWIPVKSGGRPNASERLRKPSNFDDMVKYASILSKPFPMVRVDIYNEGKIIFGELTFLTTGGFTKYEPKNFDEFFGQMFPPVSQM